jgi:hypothetical protein
MPTAVEHSIIAILKPFVERGTVPDLSVDITGLPHLPDTLDVGHNHTNPALTLNFRLAGDVNGDGGGALHLDIQLFVPAVQHHTDFLLA